VQRYNQPALSDEPFTIAAIDTSKLPTLVSQTNTLGQALSDALTADSAGESKLRAAYSAAQKFDYDASFALDPTDAYVDLADFARLLQSPDHTLSPTVSAAAQAVETA